MSNTRKATAFAVLAALFAAGSAPLAADPSTAHVFMVVPLVLMGVALLMAGYYTGLARR